jgi:hypothetical protein
MKKFLVLMLLVFTSVITFSQTEITSETISGTWTLENSPYLIKNDVAVPSGQTLRIEAGVEVRFDGLHYMHVYGDLQIDGSASQRVLLCANDTTGWYKLTVNGGGWRGIAFYGSTMYSYTLSYIKHCEIRDIKTGPKDGLFYPRTGIYAERYLPIEHLDFHHNHAKSNLIEITQWYPGIGISKAIVKNSSFYNNSVIPTSGIVGHTLYISDFDSVDISGSQFFDNKHSTVVSVFGAGNVNITKNSFENNITSYPNAVIFSVSHATSTYISENTVVHNSTGTKGALTIGNTASSFVDNNAFFNNRLEDAVNCGLTDGGAAIRITNGDNSYVRNNLICNNQSSFVGGAIAISQTKLFLTNNTIVNNYAFAKAGALYMIKNCTLVAQNNIFSGNRRRRTSPASLEPDGITSWGNNSLYFHHNFVDAPMGDFFEGLHDDSIVDTADNIIGSLSDLMMIDPTEDYGYGEDASGKNFELEESSICVNAGDSAGAYVTELDFNLSPRVVGHIDIGAFELQTGQNTSINPTENSKTNTLKLYPNPAFDHVVIEGNKRGGTLTIINSLGQIVSTAVIDQQPYKLSLSNLPAGVYRATYSNKFENSYSTFTVIK